MSLNVQAYCESFDKLKELSSDTSASVEPMKDLLEDQLDALWEEMSVEEWREIERRYPELRIRRYG